MASALIVDPHGSDLNDEPRIEGFVLDPAAPVHVAARVGHDSTRTDSIVELLMSVTMYPERGHIEEGLRKFGDEGS